MSCACALPGPRPTSRPGKAAAAFSNLPWTPSLSGTGQEIHPGGGRRARCPRKYSQVAYSVFGLRKAALAGDFERGESEREFSTGPAGRVSFLPRLPVPQHPCPRTLLGVRPRCPLAPPGALAQPRGVGKLGGRRLPCAPSTRLCASSVSVPRVPCAGRRRAQSWTLCCLACPPEEPPFCLSSSALKMEHQIKGEVKGASSHLLVHFSAGSSGQGSGRHPGEPLGRLPLGRHCCLGGGVHLSRKLGWRWGWNSSSDTRWWLILHAGTGT